MAKHNVARIVLSWVAIFGILIAAAYAYIGMQAVTKDNQASLKLPFSLTVRDENGLLYVNIVMTKAQMDTLSRASLRGKSKDTKKLILFIPLGFTVKQDGSATAKLRISSEIAAKCQLVLFFTAMDHGGDQYTVHLNTYVKKKSIIDNKKTTTPNKKG